MHAAAFPLLMNIAVAGMFAASYATITLLHPRFRAPIWFAASYALGMLTPLAQFGLGFTAWTTFFSGVVFFSFAIAQLLLVPSLAIFYHARPPWTAVAAIGAIVGLVPLLRPLIPWNTLAYQLAYQFPFMLAMAASAWVVLRDSPRRPSDLVLAGILVLLVLHFPLKAYAAHVLGTGRTPAHYIGTTYALLSQVSSGILFLATGLVLLLKAAQTVIHESQVAAETDPLSGLVNRRGLDLRATRILSRARESGNPVCLLVIDIDHFKRINDTFGHSSGDRAIKAFAAILVRAAPQAAVVARLGGEEFAVLLDHTAPEAAWLHAEAIRLAVMTHRESNAPPLTVSIGLAPVLPQQTLREALEQADEALYVAKRNGRNRIVRAADADGAGPPPA